MEAAAEPAPDVEMSLEPCVHYDLRDAHPRVSRNNQNHVPDAPAEPAPELHAPTIAAEAPISVPPAAVEPPASVAQMTGRSGDVEVFFKLVADFQSQRMDAQRSTGPHRYAAILSMRAEAASPVAHVLDPAKEPPLPVTLVLPAENIRAHPHDATVDSEALLPGAESQHASSVLHVPLEEATHMASFESLHLDLMGELDTIISTPTRTDPVAPAPITELVDHQALRAAMPKRPSAIGSRHQPHAASPLHSVHTSRNTSVASARARAVLVAPPARTAPLSVAAPQLATAPAPADSDTAFAAVLKLRSQSRRAASRVTRVAALATSTDPASSPRAPVGQAGRLASPRSSLESARAHQTDV